MMQLAIWLLSWCPGPPDIDSRMTHLVGLSMIVRNEESNIIPRHETAADLVAEIVIADTTSLPRLCRNR
jgi:hypothetical protein